MSTLLVRNASIVATFDDHRRELHDAGLFVRDGFIEQVGLTSDLPQQADDILDLGGHMVLPGLVNTHHHFYQTLTRAVAAAQNANLFNWLVALYPIWARMKPEDIFVSTQVALAELALSGCTTASDHLYIFPNGAKLDDEIEAAKQVGLRLQASRGSMSLGQSQGGLPPDSVVESEEQILKDSQRLIDTYHDGEAGAMTQIVLAPCSPFSVTQDLMKETAKLARSHNVQMHTHLAETQDEENFTQENFGMRPVAWMQTLDWMGKDVWFAHSVHVNDAEIAHYAQLGCGVAHCATSNMRLASGIAPISKMVNAGVKVGLGVDGSASNDSSHMLAETRQAMLLARLDSGLRDSSSSESGAPALMSARSALELATRGGADVLGRSDIGSLEVGKCADFFAINLERLEYAGALHDPLAALLFCAPVRADFTVVGGCLIVKEGELQTVELPKLIERHNTASSRLLAG